MPNSSALAGIFRLALEQKLTCATRGDVANNAFCKQFRGSPMPTGKKAASDAGKILSNPKSTKAQKEVAASDLAQRKDVPTAKKPKGRK
jgi:hypothetical protein